MTNAAHSTLSGSALHEPKGVGTATSGQIYIADGLGSGAWSSTSNALGLAGQIADFVTLVAPTGWLECDGTSVSRTTYATLFSAITIQQTGTRTNSSTTVTGLSSTANMKAGYFVGGTGITNGTTVASVDSPTQITLSAAATSSGSSTVIVSAFALGDGSTTFTIPDTKTNARYRRSRDTFIRVGQALADQNQTHTHTGSGTTSIEDAAHNHNVSGTTSGQSQDHTHSYTKPTQSAVVGSGGAFFDNSTSGDNTGGSSQDHTHTFSTVSEVENQNHHHTYSFTSSSSGGAEARPITLVVMTCIRT